MADAFDRGWRRFGTALSFAAFGFGGLLLHMLVFPPLRLFTREVIPGMVPVGLSLRQAFAEGT